MLARLFALAGFVLAFVFVGTLTVFAQGAILSLSHDVSRDDGGIHDQIVVK